MGNQGSFFITRRRTNGAADARSRQGADRAGDAAVQEADRTERDAERTSRSPVLRETVRTTAASATSQGKSGSQGTTSDLLSRNKKSRLQLGPPGRPASGFLISTTGR